MVVTVRSLGLNGIAGYAVSAECFLSGGLPAFDIVGLPDAAVREARERVRAAVKNCGAKFPVSRITVNLAPAGTKKAGTVYDLPIFVGVLAAAGELPVPAKDAAFIGELSLTGALRGVAGVLPMALAAKAAMGFGANLRQAEYEQVQRFSFANIEHFSTASLITRLTNDVSSVQMTMFMGMRMCVRAPVMLVTAILIKTTSPGPVIFCQERVGYKGRKFLLYKFRSMIPEAEKEGIPQLCERGDARLTRIGRFLREHHLDELPQLWNVLKGEMSFVGPRPERAYFVEQIMAINPDYRLLFRLRPGLFSMATLYNGYTDTMEKMLIRLRMDLDYLENRNLWLDTKIVLLTVTYLLGGKKI